MQRLKPLGEVLTKLGKQFLSSKEELLKELAETLAQEYPDFGGFYWCQYTPGYNDGDACYFCIGDVFLYNRKDWQEMVVDQEYPECEEPATRLPWASGAHKLIKKLWFKPFERYMQTAFGDDQAIYVSRTGEINTQDYDVGY